LRKHTIYVPFDYTVTMISSPTLRLSRA
jgi:hypothetical protein